MRTDILEHQLELVFHRPPGELTRLKRRRVRYPYAVTSPLWLEQPAGEVATVIMQSLSGGLFEGERLAQCIVVEQGAQACITNQAATVVHAMPNGGYVEQAVALTAGEDAYLEYRPQPLVMFPRSRLWQAVTIRKAATASLVLCDGFLGHDPEGCGRAFDWLQSELQVRSEDGILLLADRMQITGDQAFDGAPGVSRDIAGHGWLAVLCPISADRLDHLCAQINDELSKKGPDIYASAGRLRSGGLFLRLASHNSAGVRQGLFAALAAVRSELLGGLPSPRLP